MKINHREHRGTETTALKALSLWQPWATLMALGEKAIETRHWETSYRGDLLIHAAKHWSRDLEKMTFGPGLFRDILSNHNITSKNDLPFGCIVSSHRLINCLPTESLSVVTFGNVPLRECMKELEFGNYGDGRFMWITEGRRLFPVAIPFKGHQGLFNVPTSVLSVPSVVEKRETDHE